MRNETLYEIYKTVAQCGKMLMRRELADASGFSFSTVCKAVTCLRRAELIKEHYINKQSRFSVTGVEFLVLEMTLEGEYIAYLYGEGLCGREIKRFRTNPSFPEHDNIRSFVSEAELAAKKKRVVSVCLVTNEKYNKFCADVLPEYVAKVRIPRERAAVLMREKYFNVKLDDYLKRT